VFATIKCSWLLSPHISISSVLLSALIERPG
jgi:hypothetical protein